MLQFIILVFSLYLLLYPPFCSWYLIFFLILFVKKLSFLFQKDQHLLLLINSIGLFCLFLNLAPLSKISTFIIRNVSRACFLFSLNKILIIRNWRSKSLANILCQGSLPSAWCNRLCLEPLVTPASSLGENIFKTPTPEV